MKRANSFAPRFLASCLFSYTILAICSKSSFLYPLNDWTDINCFFTLGRGILHGLTPYRDLYEQKGPLVYLLYAGASLFSESSFLGVYLLEGLSFSFFLYISGRIAEVLSGRKVLFWPSVAITALIVPLSPAFSQGSSAEEFFLPVFASALLIALKRIHNDEPITNREGIALGLCTAAGLWTKYTFCGLFAGLALAVLIWYASTGKHRMLPKLIGCFLLGCAFLSLAVTGWFFFKGALPDLWQVYFVDNLTMYSQNKGGAIIIPRRSLMSNPTWFYVVAFGFIWTMIHIKKRKWEGLAVWLSGICLFVFTYFNGRSYPYYALVLTAFVAVGLASAFMFIQKIAPAVLKRKAAVLAGTVTAILLFLNPAAAYWAGQNTYLMKYKREETPYYRFAEIIHQNEDQSLLNYGFLDSGFYFAAGVQPTERFFCKLNINNPEMINEQKECVGNKKTAFVITSTRSDIAYNEAQSEMTNNDDYTLVESMEWFRIGVTYTYYLYQRN